MSTYVPYLRGSRRQQIVIKTFTQVSDSLGGQTNTEATFTTAWAAILPVSTKEVLANQDLEMRTTHRIITDYVSGLLGDMVVYYGTRRFEILSIINRGERDIEYELICREDL